MTDHQSNDTLTGRIATHCQIIAHSENEIRQLTAILDARKVKPLPEGFVPYDPANPPVCGEGDRIEMMYSGGLPTVLTTASFFLGDWLEYNDGAGDDRTAFRIIKATQPLKLQVGKTYGRADGEERTIIERSGISIFGFRDEKGELYQLDGKWSLGTSVNDLTREVVRETSAEVIKALCDEVCKTLFMEHNEGKFVAAVDEEKSAILVPLLTRAIELKVKEMKDA